MGPKPATTAGDAPGGGLCADQVARYHADGLIVVPGFFAPAEVEPLRTALHADPSVGGGVFESMDTSGQGHDAISWIEKSDDLIGLFPFMARMADAAEALLGEECYHWHSKLTMKPPGAPARMEWHQDFGAWYDEGLLRPDLLTIGVAIDPTTRENGATQFLKGTHALGRIDHRYEGEGQSFVDPERLEKARTRYELVQCALAPGDAVIFHCNIIHGSGGNPSSGPRTLLLCSYNAASNVPFGSGARLRAYQRIERVPDGAIRAGAYRSVFANHPFLRPDGDIMQGFGTSAAET